MSISNDLILWLKGETQRTLSAVDPANVDYAPVSRKQSPDKVAIGVSASLPVNVPTLGGGRLYADTAVVVTVTGTQLGRVENVATQVQTLFSTLNGEAPFDAPDGYGSKENILDTSLDDVIVERDEQQAVVSFRLNFDIRVA